MAESAQTTRQVLEASDRISEVLFGLIMVLAFTGSLSVADAGRDDVRTMLVGAVGCNLAWGIIDAVLYLMGSFADRGRSLLAVWQLRRSTDPARARELLASALPARVASVLQPS